MVAPNPLNRVSPSGPLSGVPGSIAFEQSIEDTAIGANSATFFNFSGTETDNVEVGDPASVSSNVSLPSGLVMSAPAILNNTVGVTIANITGAPLQTGDLILSWLVFKL